MPKPITLEMLHAMDPDQRKTLHRNASGLDTPAARAVLELLSQDDLMDKPKAPSARKSPAKPRAAKSASAKSASAKSASTKSASVKPKTAVHGRQA